jgi:hypothetical protein
VFVWNSRDAAVAAVHSVDPDRWWTAFGAVIDRIAPRFARFEPVRHAAGLMLGMLSGLDRKNCWTIAEHRGEVTPDGLQHLLSRACWDADAVRDDLRGYVIDAFADPGAVRIVDLCRRWNYAEPAIGGDTNVCRGGLLAAAGRAEVGIVTGPPRTLAASRWAGSGLAGWRRVWWARAPSV